ncbi:hypothetical protein EJB05_14713, partial [Eragrostis curvula]
MDCRNPRRRLAAAAPPAGALPDDALVEILSYLPVKPLHRFKCVARGWRDLIDDPSIRRKLAQTVEGFFVMDDGGDWGSFSFVNLLARSVPLDIDPSFSFLTSLPGIETLAFLDSCNGLLLFEHRRKSAPRCVLGYIVCNPVTKEWGSVPNCGCRPLRPVYGRSSYLVFDPAVSPHFHLILFRDEPDEASRILVMPHAYSSETGTWSHIHTDWNMQQEQEGQSEEWWRYQGLSPVQSPRRALVNGMMHLIVMYLQNLVAVDVQGKTQRIIPVPDVARWDAFAYVDVAQSQGRLHYLRESIQGDTLSIWVLKDYGTDTQEWVLLDTLNFLLLFGKRSYSCGQREFRVVAIHPDCNVVFLAQFSELKLISTTWIVKK